MKKELVGKIVLNEELTELQKNILRLAHERFLYEEDLSFGEILITLYGCRPARMGPLWVQNFSVSELLARCRSEEYGYFHFPSEAEQESYELDQASAVEAVSALAARRLIMEIKKPRIVWHADKPLVKRIEYYEMLRLTEKGKRVVGEKRRHPRHSLHLPADCGLAESPSGHPGFALNISEEGLQVDLLKRLEVGQKVKLTLWINGRIELPTRVVWIEPRSREGGSYRSGMRITELSPENVQRLGRLLAKVSPGGIAPLSGGNGHFMSC